ncbi:hypothetical protein OAQ99_01155 [Candidatus Kapabacteria bacterium]|nr:hypothetical protein [Candidatus Kapabacteria bacterium]
MSKSKMKYKSSESLNSINIVLEEADSAVKDTTRTIQKSAIPELLGVAVGAGVGGAASFAGLYFGGSIIGLSGAGITSGLAAAGGIVGGGMTAGIFVLAAPVAFLGVAGYGLVSRYKKNKLREEKEAMLQEVMKRHDAIINAIKDESNQTKQRADYLNALNILLQGVINDLREDLGLDNKLLPQGT